ncbi:hypothetical protein MPSEU_000769400 [Mayamaea pseudoterrestris]|nr:hypothetical protein MPSEU_000769400 [Mayamaea pseudoterrestris]
MNKMINPVLGAIHFWLTVSVLLWTTNAWVSTLASTGTSSFQQSPSKAFTLCHSTTKSIDSSSSSNTDASLLRVPVSLDEMTRQVARAMQQAMEKNQTTRQIARILLPRDATADDFGKYYEAEATQSVADLNTVLVPPDESWQGGIMQLYRAAAPTCDSILRQYYTSNVASSGVPPRISEDRTLDESGVDGVGLFTTDDASVTVYLQPTLEVVDDLVGRLDASSNSIQDKRITLLLNPQWRQVDDALDSASRGSGFLSNLANLLGGKGGTLQRLTDCNFEAVYNFEGYVCRGSNIRLLQVLDSDWVVFCQRDDSLDAFVKVGTIASRPTYQQVESMLDQAGISFKYSRDMGWEPKL